MRDTKADVGQTNLRPPSLKDPAWNKPYVRTAVERQTTLLLDRISYSYGSTNKREVGVLDQVSLECQIGTWTAIMGPSGAGKSTLLHCAAGLLPVQSGNVIINGQNLTGMREGDLTRMRRDTIGFIFQDYNLISAFTSLQNTMLTSLFGGKQISTKTALDALDRVGMRGYDQTYPSDMSGGEQQRVAIARTLAANPKIIMADEPTGALDTHNSEEIMNLFSLAAQDGHTILMVTHDPNVAARAHRVIFLQDGHIQAECPGGDPQTIAQELTQMEGSIPGSDAINQPQAVPFDQPQ